MNQTIMIFVTGVTGVFIGMALLYGVIKLNTLITDYILSKREGK